jgi:glycosyltransferase involved in cell wall biosynthesis
VTQEPLSLAFLGDPNSIHTRRWITFFAARGHRVTLLVSSTLPVEDGLDERIAVVRFRMYPIRVRILSSIVSGFALRGALRAVKAQVLHAHYLTRYGWLGYFSRFRPLVVTVWGSDAFVTPASSRRARLWGRRTLQRAALVTAVSQALADRAVELGARPERVRLVQFGVDGSRFRPGIDASGLRAALGLAGRRVIFSPRGMRALYRHEVAIEALTQLPDDVDLVIPCQSPEEPYLAHLRAEARRLGLGRRVHFIDPIDHERMADFYTLADVVVSIPETDAFPVTALEAMACGRPIVMSDLPSAQEGLGGVDPTALVPVGDAGATARAIQARLNLPPEMLSRLGARLRAAALTRAEESVSLGAMEAEYRALVRERR